MKRSPARAPTALVLGAGVQGLSCAVRLWERGWAVRLCARDWSNETTSAGAGAVWEYPPFQVQPQRAARRWMRASLAAFAACAGSPATGVRLRRSYYMYTGDPAAARRRAESVYGRFDLWTGDVPDFREGDLPEGVATDGRFGYSFSYVAPVLNMRLYMSWLTDRVRGLEGIQLLEASLEDRAAVDRLAEQAGAGLVVNCLGLGSKRVFGDESMYAVQGDLVYVRHSESGFSHVSDEDHGLTYAIPQADGTVALAGTAQPISEAELDAHGYRPRSVSHEAARGIIDRMAISFPALASAPVVGGWSGARPQREGGVRLELERLAAAVPVLHNYGHGGSGVVTSWGCADQVGHMASVVVDKLEPRRLPEPLSALGTDCVDRLGRQQLALACRAAETT